MSDDGISNEQFKKKRSLSLGSLSGYLINPKSGGDRERNLSEAARRCRGVNGHERRRSLTAKASQLIVQIPVDHLRKIRQKQEVKSWDREAQHFCGITTMHGPLRAYRGKIPYRHLWGGMMILSFSLLAYQIHTIVGNYLSKPVNSQVSFTTADSGLHFPLVTLCNYNPIKKSYIQKLNRTGLFTDAVFLYLVQANAELQAFYGTAKFADLEDGHHQYLLFKNDYNESYNVNDFFEEGGYDCEDVFKICSFAGEKFDCCSYVKRAMTSLGRCYTLDMAMEKRFRRQLAPGEYSGLQLILDSQLDQIYSGAGNESDPVFTNSFENGFRFYVHDRELVSFITSEGISVSPGSRVYASMETERYIRLSKGDWGQCSDEWPSSLKTPEVPYSRKNCRAVCRANYFNEKCDCAPYVYNTRRLFHTCSPRKLYHCLNNIGNFTLAANIEMEQLCSECNVECQNWEYHAYNSYGFGYSKGAQKWLRERDNQWTLDRINNNFVMASVYYRDLAYTLFSEEKGTSISSALSDIGGNMGLCFGMSVITMVEILIFLSKLSWISFSGKRRDYMLEKKLQEEEKERNLEATVEEFTRERKKKLEEELSNDQSSSTVHRLKKLSVRLGLSEGRNKRKICDINGPEPHHFQEKKQSRQEAYMSNFYEQLLNGSGRVNLKAEDSFPEEDNDDLLELKIDLQDNGKEKEIVGVLGETRGSSRRNPALPIRFRSKTVNLEGDVQKKSEGDPKAVRRSSSISESVNPLKPPLKVEEQCEF